jgi:hypothetical protein
LRRRVAAVSITLTGLFLFAYFVPFIYTGNFVTIGKNPPPWSKVYGSLSCIILLYLKGYYASAFVTYFIAPGYEPPPWNWLGTIYQGGHYYFFCNPQWVPVSSA